MKGVFIHQQVEYRLEVTGDKFQQGDSVPCTLTVKNHGDAPQTIPGLRLELAVGNLKKIKDQAEGAFQPGERAQVEAPGQLGGREQKSVSWTFQLDRNSPVTDKNSSLHFIYGNDSVPGALGHLPLAVEIHTHVQAVMKTLETTFQFLFKGHKTSEGWATSKFKPSSAKRFSLVNELQLCSRFDGESLLLKYVFKVKKFDASVSSITVKKGVSEFEQQLAPEAYLLPGGYVNYETLEKRIDEALTTVATGL